MRNILVVTTVIVLLLVSFLGITYSYEYNDTSFPVFELLGPYELELELGSEYIESGIMVTLNGEDISSLVKIDRTLLDMNKVGEYKVKYELNIDGYNEYICRIVKVREYINPVIKLIGDDVIYLKLNETYIDPGYELSDNYDVNLEDKIIITSNIKSSEIGEYTIEYKVTDSSGNKTSISRTVIVR